MPRREPEKLEGATSGAVAEPGDSPDQQPLPGAVGGAFRVGRTVRRPTGPWTPAVHELLTYLAQQPLRGVPEVGGIDDQGREILTYMQGRSVPVDDEVVTDEVLAQAATWLREFHDTVDGFRPVGPRYWRTAGETELAQDQIVCHNDPGAYNWIIEGGRFVAMIDWDMAGPGERLDDAAFMAWTAIPLYREIPADVVARRLNLYTEAYAECGPLTLINRVVDRMSEASARIEGGIQRGDPGFLNLAKIGEPERTRDRLARFVARVPAIRAELG